MPPARPFSSKTATKYALVHRAHNDPLINDENAPSQVFTEISGPSRASGSHAGSSKIKQRGDLEEEFGLSGEALPENEEVAAEHGVRFRDQYDYLQHLRDLGQGGGDTAFIEAQGLEKSKGKGKQKLEDALRDVRLDDDADDMQSQGGMSMFSGAAPRDQSGWQRYQEQQNIPDEIAGFQPDMDPRLREVLEALDDEAYVDDDHDLFDELAEGGEEVDRDIWEEMGMQEEEDGWESDDTAKAVNDDVGTTSAPPLTQCTDNHAIIPTHDVPPPPAADEDDKALFEAMAQAKAEKQSEGKKPPPAAPSAAFTTDTAATGLRKKRKGALTSSTGFSMTSSALARTEAMSTLDSRFDKVLDSYMDDIDEDEEFLDDTASAATGMSKMTGASKMSFASRADSEAPSLVSNSVFNNAMDEYLVGSGKKGKKMKKGGKQGFWGQQNGLDQLDEIRQGLGPARVQRA